MASDIAVAETIRLVAAASALFAGLAASACLRSILPGFRDAQPGIRRFYAAAVSASFAVATGSWAFVAAARRGAAPAQLAWYAAAGFSLGLLSGFFPRAVGIPSIAVVALAAGVAVAGLAPLSRWVDGSVAARLVVDSVTGNATMATVTIAGPRGTPVDHGLELPPGPIELEFDVVELRGPLALAFGAWRYRVGAVIAGGKSVPIAPYREPLLFSGNGDPLAWAFGCSVETIRTAAFVPDFLASVSFVMSPGGTIEPSGR